MEGREQARRLCERAEILIDVKRPGDAIPLLARAVTMDPESSRPQCLLALAHLRLRQYEDALAWVEKAIHIQPGGEWQHRLRSTALRLAGRSEESLAPALEAARLAPNLPEALYNLAQSELSTGRRDEARATGARLMALAPEMGIAHEIAGLLSAQDEEWAEAEVHWRDALARNPGEMRYHNNLAVALLRQGKTEESIDRFHAAARLVPTEETVKSNLRLSVESHVRANPTVLARLLTSGLWLAMVVAWWEGYLTRILGEIGLPFPAVITATAVAILTWDAVKAAMGQLYLRAPMKTLHPTVAAFFAAEERRELFTRLLGSPRGFAARVIVAFVLAGGVAAVLVRQISFAWVVLLVPLALTALAVRLRRHYQLPLFPWRRTGSR